MKFKLLNSEQMYQGWVFNVRRDQVRTPANQQIDLDIVEHSNAVTIIPLDDRGQIWFVRQYRHAAGQELLELPAGKLEDFEPPEDCARREIREEIGMAAGQMEEIGAFFLAPGYSTEYMHVYLATNLHPDPLPSDEDEFLSVVAYPVEQAFQMVRSGYLLDAKSLAALLLFKERLRGSLNPPGCA
jgi:ADP-ribose pyrophosphatase